MKDLASSIANAPKLGTCCICGTPHGVRTIVMHDRRCAIPGHGWGCVVCGLPPDGAVSVLCDRCALVVERDPGALRIACRGWPASDGHIPIDELPEGTFTHDAAKHLEEERS